MTSRRFHSSQPDRWVSPRPSPFGARARDIYGPIQPMQSEPRKSWLARIFGR